MAGWTDPKTGYRWFPTSPRKYVAAAISERERRAAERARASADDKRIPAELRARVRMSIAEPSATTWCTSHNHMLGARPIDMWRLGRQGEVLNLLDAIDEGVHL